MTKRLFSFLLASILMTCTCLSAFAADSQGGAISNTIGNVYNGASDVQSAVSDPVTWYVSNQIVGDSKYSDGIDLICPNGDYEEHYDDAFSSAVCPYDGEALIIKGNGVTFTPGGGSGNLGMGVGRKDLPGYTGGVSNVNRSGVLMNMILLLLLIILHLSLAQVRVLLISRFFVLIIKVIILSLILSEQILNTPFRVPMMYSRLKCGRPIPRLHFIMVWAFRLRLLRLLTGIMLFIPHLHIVVEDMRPEIILHIVVKTKSFHGIRVHLDIPRFLVLTMLKVNQSL